MLPNLLTPARAEAWRRTRPAAAAPDVQQPTASPDYLRVALYVLAAVLLALLGPLLHRAASVARLPLIITTTTTAPAPAGPSLSL